jgi:cob(I)alamin adenosyltransferase
MSRISTKTGDLGVTSLSNGERVPKNSLRIESCGTVDELNAFLGVARVEILEAVISAADREILIQAIDCSQKATGLVLSALAAPQQSFAANGGDVISEIESLITTIEQTVDSPRQFVVPGVSRAESSLHVARVVCRRAERRVVALETGECGWPMVALNRLSDLLFVMAGLVLRAQGKKERYRDSGPVGLPKGS